MNQEERELVARCQAGDLAAFEPLVEKYRQRVWRLAYQVVGDREEAWDVAQDAFVRAYQSLPEFRGESTFYTWLFRIVVNLATDRRRQQRARARALGGEAIPEEVWERTTADSGSRPDLEASRVQARERIARALDALPPPHRTIIILSDIEGLSYREIAEVLGCPIGTVMSRLHNARRRLRALLGPVLGVLLALWIAFGAQLAWAQPPQGQPPQAPPPWAPPQAQPPQAPPPWAPPQARPPQAQPPHSPPQSVPVSARIVWASNAASGAPPPAGSALVPGGRPPDEAFRFHLNRLRQVFGYQSYEQLDLIQAQIPLGLAQRFALPGGRELELRPTAVTGAVVRMDIKILNRGAPEVSIVADVPANRPALVGGPPYGGGVLIISITAQPQQ